MVESTGKDTCLYSGGEGVRMDSERCRKKRTNVEEEEEVDRLSSLPDDLIHKIFSFIGIKPAIETSVLSSRWRFVWTSMSCLDFSCDDFSTLPKFSKFVTQFLSRRNTQIEVSSLDLSFRGKVTQPFVKKLLAYAYSHNIQQLNVSYTSKNDIEFPLSLFSSQSLKHLSFTSHCLPTTSTLELPALTTLYLHGLTLCCDNNSDNCNALFSKCPNLKNLTLSYCSTKEWNNFSICLPQLSNLTLKNGPHVKVINVVAPQLENLIISYRSNNTEHVISAPNLNSLVYDGYRPLHLSTDGFHSLKEADICVYLPKDEDAHQIVCMFQQFHNVKFLTLNLEIVEILSSSLEPILNQPSPFANLKSLEIYPAEELSEEEEQKIVKMSNEVKNYLLDNSASATFTMVTREEIRAKKNTELAKYLMEELWELIEEEKAKTKTKTNRANMEQTKTQGENQLQIGGRVKYVNRCWEDLSSQIEQGREKTSDIISQLKEIKELLKKLPTSKREELQTCFPSLCAEADTVVKNILDDMKIQCDMKERRFSVYFHELAQTSESSS